MTELDRSIFFLINNGLRSPINDLWLGYATWLGNGWVAFPVALGILFYTDRKSFGRNALLLTIAAIFGGILNSVVKELFHAPRPLEVFRTAIEAGHIHVHVMFEALYANSFPSGHAQTAATVATILVFARTSSDRYKKQRLNIGAIILGLIVLAVATSRIYVGAHFQSDVVAGMLIGGGSSAFVCWVYSFRFRPQYTPGEIPGILLEREGLETNATL